MVQSTFLAAIAALHPAVEVLKKLQPPNLDLTRIYYAKGTQEYECKFNHWESANFKLYLFDNIERTDRAVAVNYSQGNGRTVIKSLTDQSSVHVEFGKVKDYDQAEQSWLLVENDQLGDFTGTQFILKLNTVGGLPAAGNCNDGDRMTSSLQTEFWIFKDGKLKSLVNIAALNAEATKTFTPTSYLTKRAVYGTPAAAYPTKTGAEPAITITKFAKCTTKGAHTKDMTYPVPTFTPIATPNPTRNNAYGSVYTNPATEPASETTLIGDDYRVGGLYSDKPLPSQSANPVLKAEVLSSSPLVRTSLSTFTALILALYFL